GFAAKALGDPTASERGRLTLNPIAHVDPIGTLLVPGGLLLLGAPAFGWAKPVPVNKWRLSNPRFGMMAVAAAGPLSNFVLAAVGAVLLGIMGTSGAGWAESEAGFPMLLGPDGAALPIATGLYFFILINVFLGMFNLLPIPPFDGSHIVGGLLPKPLRIHWEKLQRFGMILILGVIAFSWIFGTGWLEVTVLPLVAEVMSFYEDLANAIALA
ncbi:MAG: site-2 protease family protein, partial [Pseudomonadota bacterium]